MKCQETECVYSGKEQHPECGCVTGEKSAGITVAQSAIGASVVVPREPTPEMLAAASRAWDSTGSLRNAFLAMLAVASSAQSEYPKSKLRQALDRARGGDVYKMQGAVFACDDIAEKAIGEEKKRAKRASDDLNWLLDQRTNKA